MTYQWDIPEALLCNGRFDGESGELTVYLQGIQHKLVYANTTTAEDL